MSPPPPPPPSHRRVISLFPPLLAAVIALVFFLLSAFIYRKISRKRTAPADLKPPLPSHRFSFSLLRRATDSFSTANRLGQGGFGSVYKGVLPSGQEIAVKLTSEASIQGEREFQNELSLAARIDSSCCPHFVCILGFSSTFDVNSSCKMRYYSRRRKRRGRRLVLVYEYMQNGSLQDALLDRKCAELMIWSKRFAIVMSIAKGLDYLHNCSDPAIVHGDIKPSNILLDFDFNAKISDFGLAQVLNRGDEILDMFVEEEEKIIEGKCDECGSIVEENESLMTEDVVVVNVDQSPDSFCVMILDGGTEASAASPSEHLAGLSEGFLERMSFDSGSRKGVVVRGKCDSGRDWWWKQDNMSGLSESGRVKDYVMEWIGSEIGKEKPKEIKLTSSFKDSAKVEHKKLGKKLEWWGSLDRETMKKDRRNRKPREWWKEEFCEELAKKKKKRGLKSSDEGGLWWQGDEEIVQDRKRSKSRSSRSSVDRWLDGFSGDFKIGRRRNSQDYASGEIPKSGGISSTPSMRGTVCYAAPEYSGGAQVSDKCDVYSFGVLLLVLVSGRRPLQVMASPISEFERANLISWARQLALNGRLLDLVDSSIQSLDREQALLCITVALLCLQRSPNKRPSMADIVEMLSGRSEAPHLPFEFSPSPPSKFPFKSQKRSR
ncbi:receptor-like serine/threonine-protein kinase At2g45590 [Primulina eburnea]|uniref:receptor-like serine/threonine-protein kinase At2g45590 n=1 Tax=Primulina eburnea TaxID=1245227 RepID=UPI003C6CACC3